MDKKLEKLHKVEVEILDKIVEVCDKYDIKYFFIGGSLLGAVRHKGFIPWDDDIDLGMLREDYEKFRDVCINDNALGDKYFLDCDESDDNYFLPFMKVKKNNTTFMEKCLENIDMHKGIFVDIFPYDNTTGEHGPLLKVQAALIKILIDSVYVKMGAYSLDSRRRKQFVRFFQIFSVNRLKRFIFKLSTLHNKKNTKYVNCFCGTFDYVRECTPKDKIFPLKKVLFEGKMYNGMNDNHYFLTRQFHNYMELPKESDRRTHLPVKISFTEGENRVNRKK